MSQFEVARRSDLPTAVASLFDEVEQQFRGTNVRRAARTTAIRRAFGVGRWNRYRLLLVATPKGAPGETHALLVNCDAAGNDVRYQARVKLGKRWIG